MKIKLYSEGENFYFKENNKFENWYKKDNGGFILFNIHPKFIKVEDNINSPFKDHYLTLEDKYYNVCFCTLEDKDTIYKYETIHINFLKNYFNFMEMVRRYYYFTLVINENESITIKAFNKYEDKQEWFNNYTTMDKLKEFKIIHYLKWNINTIELIKEVEKCFSFKKLQEYKKVANLNLKRDEVISLINKYKNVEDWLNQQKRNISNEEILNTLKTLNYQQYLKLKDYFNDGLSEWKLKEYETILKDCEKEAQEIFNNQSTQSNKQINKESNKDNEVLKYLKQYQNEKSIIDWSNFNKEDYLKTLQAKLNNDLKDYEEYLKECSYSKKAQRIKEVFKTYEKQKH